jgi:hypothetical protein
MLPRAPPKHVQWPNIAGPNCHLSLPFRFIFTMSSLIERLTHVLLQRIFVFGAEHDDLKAMLRVFNPIIDVLNFESIPQVA